jgi:glycosyltransferase involved in cell wall biosynthesis
MNVLCVARLVPKKGVDMLLRATARLAANHPALRVAVIGTGPLLDDLLALRRELGLDEIVEFAGAATSSQVTTAMNRASVVALACRIDESGDRDGMPTVLVEALSRAVPVVSTDVPGISELVRDGVTGRLVPPDDDAAFAAALHEMLTNPELARRLGRAGRDLVGAEFTPAAATRQLLDVFGGSAPAALEPVGPVDLTPVGAR